MVSVMKLDRNALDGLGKVASFGFTLAASMFLFGWIGLWLDSKLHTVPFFTAGLFLAGGAVALWYGIIRFLK